MLNVPLPSFFRLALIGSLSTLITLPPVQGSEVKWDEMPGEYLKIKELVGRVQKYNDLGNIPLTFTVVNGSYGRWVAEELRLCKEDECSYYENLNPFGFSGKKEKEIVRQSRLYGDIEGSAYTNGTIKLSQSTFRILEGKDNFLMCLLAHEISHVITRDTYEVSKASVEGGFDSDSDEDQLKRAKLYQQNELDADKEAIIMVANSGFAKDSCKKFEAYLVKSIGIVQAEDQNGTHPSTRRRLLHAERMTEQYIAPSKNIIFAPREWRYNKKNNFLFLAPIED